jgi:pimeloyl-ACP methyl ester carboxylesterase
MSRYRHWNSQPLESWSDKYAAGKTIYLDGQRTHYLEAGQGDPVILIHGFLYDSSTWHRNIDYLAQQAHVFAIDLWGFGYSTRDNLDFSFALFEKQILLFMDALGIRQASLVGHSMGGGTSIALAVHHPERVDKLILVDTVGMPDKLPPLGRITHLPVIGELMYGLPGKFTRRLALRMNWFYDPAFVTPQYVDKVTHFHKIKGSTRVMLKILRKQFFHTLHDEIRTLGTLELPVMVVWGREDQSIPFARAEESRMSGTVRTMKVRRNSTRSRAHSWLHRLLTRQHVVEYGSGNLYNKREHFKGADTADSRLTQHIPETLPQSGPSG